jgi:tRNA-splicing ligase RtcB
MEMQLIDGTIPVFGEADEKTLKQIRTCAKTADRVALMPDNHLGYGVPIGGVVAYRNAISPTGVGYDIGCGNKAARLDMTGADLPPNIGRIMDEVADTISFGIGRKNAERVDSAVLDKAQDGWNLEATRPLYQKAGAQLGTVGSGNHYVDIFTDEDDRVWVGATLDPAALVTELPLGFSRQPARKTAWTLSRVFWT